ALGEDAYPGEYLIDVARALAAEQGDELARLPEAEAVARCREFAARALLAGIQEDLARFGVRFDHFVSERALHAESVFARARAALPADLLYEQDGALFFRTTHFGDEKDRVVVRGNGEPTYFGSDIAHYYRTLSRRFDALVNVLAPEPDLTRLGDGETEPLRVLVTFPDVVEAAARDLEPHRIVFYALDLAAAFHRYYNQHRILSDDPGATQARLALVRCVQQV